MRRWYDKYFQKHATSFVKNIWRRVSLVYDYVFDREKCLPDRYILWGIMMFSVVGLVYATFVIQNSSKINVDSVKLAQERREQLQKKRTSTPLRNAPFAMSEIPELTFPNRECSIVDFGAVSGGKASNTESFRKAIASCASAGGGRVSVPKGTWLTGAIHLKSNINLFLDEGAVILFSDNHK